MKFERSLSHVIVMIMMIMPIDIVAHPSWGIAVDQSGVVYFVDVLHHGGTLWKYDWRNERQEALFSGDFHAHSLQMVGDELYIGVNVWKEGEIEGSGHNYLFRYNINTRELDTLEFSSDYDRFYGGNVLFDADDQLAYYPMNKTLRVFDLKSERTSVVNPHLFERLSTTGFDHQERVWATDSYAHSGSLYFLNGSGQWELYARNLIDPHPENPVYAERSHYLLYGFCFNQDNHPVITESATRSVWEIKPNGKKKLIYISPENHFPCGVFFWNNKYIVMEVGYIKGKGHVGPYIVTLAGNRMIRTELKY